MSALVHFLNHRCQTYPVELLGVQGDNPVICLDVSTASALVSCLWIVKATFPTKRLTLLQACRLSLGGQGFLEVLVARLGEPPGSMAVLLASSFHQRSYCAQGQQGYLSDRCMHAFFSQVPNLLKFRPNKIYLHPGTSCFSYQ